MKKWKILNLIIFHLTASTIFGRSLNKTVSSDFQTAKVLHDVSFELFGRYNISYDILTFGNLTSNVDQVVNKFTFITSRNRTISTRKYKVMEYLVDDKPAVIFLNHKEISLKSLRLLVHINKLRSGTPIPFGKSTLIFVENKNIELKTISANPVQSNTDISLQAYFLVDHGKIFKLKTFEWWTQKACNLTQLVTLNSFDKVTSTWKSELTIQKKFLNFHGCTLRVYSSVFNIPAIDYLRNFGLYDLPPIAPELFIKREPHDIKFLKMLADYANFTFIRPPYDDPGYANEDYGNPDFILILRLDFIRAQSDSGKFFTNEEIRVIYSPREPFTNYEKMGLPFDFDTWFYLLITFGLAFVSIFLLNFFPTFVKDEFFGKGVNMPSFNVIGTFFGIGQTRLPDNNFARIVLMGFIIFCLIFRTAYQGVFFTMMTTDMRRPPPNSFTDLREQNYTLYLINELSLGFIIGLIDDKPRTKMASFAESHDIYYQIKDLSAERLSMILTDVDHKVFKAFGQNIPKLIDEKIELTPFGVNVPKETFGSALVVESMKYLVEGGIPQQLFHLFFDFELMPMLDDIPEPSVFSLADLEFGFVVWLITCGISIFVFLLEILCFYLRILIVNLFGNLIVLLSLVRVINDIRYSGCH